MDWEEGDGDRGAGVMSGGGGKSVQEEIEDNLDEIFSRRTPPESKTIALKRLEMILGAVCVSDTALIEFERMQDSFECNIPSRLLSFLSSSSASLSSTALKLESANAERDLETEPQEMEQQDQERLGHVLATLTTQILLSLSIIQGIALTHQRSKRWLARGKCLEVFVELLLASRHITSSIPFPSTSSPSKSQPQPATASAPSLTSTILDTLLCILVDSSLALRAFESCGGVQAIVKILKRAGTPREVRMKCLEFLYFYLLDETKPTPFATSSTTSTSTAPPTPIAAPTIPASTTTPTSSAASATAPLHQQPMLILDRSSPPLPLPPTVPNTPAWTPARRPGSRSRSHSRSGSQAASSLLVVPTEPNTPAGPSANVNTKSLRGVSSSSASSISSTSSSASSAGAGSLNKSLLRSASKPKKPCLNGLATPSRPRAPLVLTPSSTAHPQAESGSGPDSQSQPPSQPQSRYGSSTFSFPGSTYSGPSVGSREGSEKGWVSESVESASGRGSRVASTESEENPSSKSHYTIRSVSSSSAQSAQSAASVLSISTETEAEGETEGGAGTETEPSSASSSAGSSSSSPKKPNRLLSSSPVQDHPLPSPTKPNKLLSSSGLPPLPNFPVPRIPSDGVFRTPPSSPEKKGKSAKTPSVAETRPRTPAVPRTSAAITRTPAARSQYLASGSGSSRVLPQSERKQILPGASAGANAGGRDRDRPTPAAMMMLRREVDFDFVPQSPSGPPVGVGVGVGVSAGRARARGLGHERAKSALALGSSKLSRTPSGTLSDVDAEVVAGSETEGGGGKIRSRSGREVDQNVEQKEGSARAGARRTHSRARSVGRGGLGDIRASGGGAGGVVGVAPTRSLGVLESQSGSGSPGMGGRSHGSMNGTPAGTPAATHNKSSSSRVERERAIGRRADTVVTAREPRLARTTEEKKELLGTMLGNVDALVEGVSRAGIWGLA